MRRIAFGFLIVISIGLYWFFNSKGRESPLAAPPLVQIEGQAPAQEFARAFEQQELIFPRDHGPHFDYQTEWWYFTGNLEGVDGLHYGYQLTFFRRGLSPGLEERQSTLASNQVYFAHFAITDVSGDQHTEVERFSRGAELLAGAQEQPFAVWLENWSLRSLDSSGKVMALSAADGDLELELELSTQKNVVLHGHEGLSQKSDADGNASYYVSHTRLETVGQIAINGESIEVSGLSWFDHEWSTSALGEGAVGWDWFGLNLSDGRDLMLFLIRNRDGSIDSVSGGTLVERDGSTVRLEEGEIEINSLRAWTSPISDVEYPSGWTVSIPIAEIELRLEPLILDQEMNISIVYWEGAVRIEGSSAGIAVTGNGYVELTGYAHTLQGVF
jgi:predicted secreted hydrolase